MSSMTAFVSFLVLSVAGAAAQISTPEPAAPPAQQAAKPAPLSQSDLAQLQVKAEAGDATAQGVLGQAYRDGNGVPQNDALAVKWFQKAADQGDATAENNLGIMYRMGEGVVRDKEEAVRWYEKAAKGGSSQAMFNLGASYYNGDGVASNAYIAYAWFLLAQDAGNPAAQDAVRRTAATMSRAETADALIQIATMYEKGEELPKSEEQTVRWLRKAAEISSQGKVRLAIHLLTQPDATHNYAEALDLCRAAAKDYAPGQSCVGYLYRKGWGVTQDSTEAVKWYQKAAAASNLVAVMALAEMYENGEGTKVDRPAAFMLLYQAARMGVSGAKQKANDLLARLNKAELKQLDGKLRDRKFDPKSVFAAVQDKPSS